MKMSCLHPKNAVKIGLSFLFLIAIGVTNLFAVEPDDPIVFADEEVKTICVAHWDTNDDGELSYAEAAAVTDMEGCFEWNWGITSFDELQYFTGLSSIGNYAFYYCGNLNSIVFPSSLVTIGEEAFYGCSGLTGSITITENISSIGYEAFARCSQITTLNYNAINCVLYEDWLEYCSSLHTLNIGEQVEIIPDHAFNQYGLSFTGNLVIPSSVTSIGEWAFGGNDFSSLVCFAETPPTLGEEAFYQMSSNIPVYVPCGFEDAYATTSWGIFNNIQGMCGGTVTVAANTTEGGTVAGGGTIGNNQSCTVTATANPGYVFVYWTNNGEVVSTDSEYTFYVAGNITLTARFVAVQPGNITFADPYVKATCVQKWDSNGDGELSYEEAASVVDLGEAFRGNRYITYFDELQFFLGLTSIGRSAFADCTRLTSIVLSNSIVSIGYRAFEDTRLREVTLLAETPPTLDQYPFGYSNSANVKVNVPCEAVEAYSNSSWAQYCNIQGLCGGTVTVVANLSEGGSVTGGGMYVSGETCTIMATPNQGYVFVCWFKDGTVVSTSNPYTFYVAGDQTLTAKFLSVQEGNITFTDDEVKNICIQHWDTNGDGELSYAEAAVVVDLYWHFGDNREIISFDELQYFIGLTSIGSEAFRWCESLTSVVLPSSLTSIGDDAFEYCSSLSSIEFPSSLTSIGSDAFRNCSSLTEITIGENITNIGYNAFENCSNITTLNYNAINCVVGDEYYGSSWLGDCYSLHTLNIGDQVQVIPNYAFYGSNVTFRGDLILPGTLTSIGQNAFGENDFLAIYCLATTPPTLNEYAFSGMGTSLPVYVPCGVEDDYENVSWGGFNSFQGMCEGTVAVAANPLEGGVVSGNGTYMVGETCTVTATTNSGYVFLYWTNNNGQVVSKNNEYTFLVAGDLTLTANFVSVPNGNIVFADSNVKNVCVSYWDTNDDDELSYAEAASVKYLDRCFTNNSNISSFIELQYFLGLTSIDNYAFNYCYRLTTVAIPRHVTVVGRNAFRSTHLMEMALLTETPPTLGEYSFDEVDHNIPVYVPCDAVNTYVGASWGGFSNIQGLCEGAVTAVADPTEGGVVTGGGVYSAGANCTVNATANEGYAFGNWTKNGQVISINSEYTFLVAGDMTLEAHFVPVGNIQFADNMVKYICVDNWDSNYDGNLSYAEAAVVTELGDSFRYYYNSQVVSFDELKYFIGLSSIGSYAFYDCSRLSAIALPNTIKRIGEGAFGNCNSLASLAVFAEVPPTLGDNVFENVNQDITIYVPCGYEDAYSSVTWGGFDNIQGMCGGTVTVTVNPSEGGTAAGGGTFGPNETCTVSATVTPGYSFNSWSINDEVVSNTREFSFYVTTDVTLTANFVEVPTGCIAFADDIVKSICVNNWDTDGDGELSYGEAAEVTSLSNEWGDGYFSYNSEITSFDELQYFVGLNSIDNYAFYQCNQLASVTIPSSVGYVGYRAFAYCGLSSLTILATTPPTLDDYVFGYGQNTSLSVFVPCGSEQAYLDISWGGISNIYGLCDGSVTVAANPTEGGTVTGGGDFEGGTFCTVTAGANDGFVFANWINNGRIASKDAVYSFRVAGDMALVANFVPEGNITFADANVKSICVAHWDTNGDGELSFVEAAAVTSLSDQWGDGYFQYNDGITSFDELQYFIGLTLIDQEAFRDCENITSVVLPSNVISIGREAFRDCSNLSGVLTIPATVTSIGYGAFQNTGFSTLNYNAVNCVVNTNGAHWLMNCDSLTTLIIGEGVEVIPDYAFSNYYDYYGYSSFLGSLTIPNTVTSIGQNAFYRNRFTELYVLATAPPTLGNNAFYNVTNTVSVVYVPCNSQETYESNSWGGFGSFTGLCAGTITVVANPDGAGSLTGGGYYESGQTCTLTATANTGYIFVTWNKNGKVVSTNAEYTFFVTGDDTLTAKFVQEGNIVFADDNVKNICVQQWDTDGDGELSYAEAAVVTSLNQSFSWNNDIISFDELQYFIGLPLLENYAFDGCSDLISVILPNSLMTMGYAAFGYCSDLATLIVLAETPPSGSDWAFEGVDTNIPVFVPCNSYDAYSENSWGGFTNFNGLCSGTVTVIADPIGTGTVSGGGYYESGQSCTVSAVANEGCSFVFWTNNGKKVSTNSEYTFLLTGDATLVAHFLTTEPIVFADANVKSICIDHWDANGDGELSYAEAAMVTDLNNYFRGNEEIVSFDELQFFIGLSDIAEEAFSFCMNLETVSFPQSIVSIGDDAFYYCIALSGELHIPNSVLSMGYDAFGSCYSLSGSLVLPPSLTVLESNVFEYCSGFTGDLVIPNSITTIESGAFAGCTGFDGNLTIGESVTNIESYAFGGCSSIQSITVLSSVVPVAINDPFGDCNLAIPVTVPCGLFEDFYNSKWGGFTNFVDPCGAHLPITVVAIPNEGGLAAIGNMFQENFNTYSIGDQIAADAVGNSQWTTWTNTPGSEEDGTVAEIYGEQCGYITQANDQVLLLGDKESGTYDLEFDILVPQGKSGYFNMLHGFDGSGSVWAMCCYLHEDGNGSTPGSGMVWGGNSGTQIPCVYDEWMHFQIHVDIYLDIAQLYFNTAGRTAQQYLEWQWSQKLYGMDYYSNKIAAIDFYPISDSSCFYIDNISFRQTGGMFSVDNDCTVAAVANEGYAFNGWKEDDVIVSTANSYSFTIAGSRSLVADFTSTAVHFINSGNWNEPANWSGGVLPGADDVVIIDGNCHLNVDAIVASLYVSEGNVLTIDKDKTLVVNNLLITDDYYTNLILTDGASLFHGNSNVHGAVEKTIHPFTQDEKDGWNLIAMPMVGSTDPNNIDYMLGSYYMGYYKDYDLYYYNEPTHFWINYKDPYEGFFELQSTKGYLYAKSIETSLLFDGVFNNGAATINVPLSYTAGMGLSGFNLIGNPFVHDVTSYGAVNVADGCFRMNETGDNLIVSEISSTDPLKPTEGFFVKAIAEDASITFNPSTSGGTRNEKETPNSSIRLDVLEEDKIVDRLIVKNANAQPLEKFSLNEQSARIYAIQNDQAYAIVTCEENEQPVYFKVSKNGSYTLRVITENAEFDYLHLIDNISGTDVDLLANPSYSFDAQNTDYASRFKLVFKTNENGNENENFAFISNGNLMILGIDGEATLQVIDITGRILSSETFNGSYNKAVNEVAGVYMIRLIQGENVRTQKIVVK